MRTGIGVDVHKLVAGRPLILGGVRIEHHLGLDGHSDADVLLHAVCDALLGAAALGDIGAHFPASSPQWQDADSMELLRAVVAKLADRELSVANVDATVIAEAPPLAPHRDAMRANIAAACVIDAEQVGVKATTTEGLGLCGRGEGIAAIAVCLLQPATA